MKFYLEVYGCTANKSDAHLIKGILKENNFKSVKKIDEADVIIILTCTVINTTEQRMLSRLRLFKKTNKKVIVSGCMASIQTDLIKTVLPDAKIIPAQYTYHIIDALNEKKIDYIYKSKTSFSKHYDDIIAPISISEGCEFSCTYCITSIARGKLVSYPIYEIIKNINSAIKQNCKEIQLTAQDTSSYGLDIGLTLGDLLKNVNRIKGEFRIRVGMMNPYTCLKNIDSILYGFKDKKIYKFLHLPVQSGNNEILEKMNRKYSVNDFLNIVNKFRKYYQDITISTDIIVGFPTETNFQFQKTIDLLNKVKPDITNITRYSARPFTKAKIMKGRVKTELVKARSKILTKLCEDISKQNNKKYIGKNFIALITEKGKNNTFMGRIENYKPIIIKEKVELGEFIKVEVEEAASAFLVGSII